MEIFKRRLENQMAFGHQTRLLPFENKTEAKKVCKLLNSNAAQEFFKSFIFWDAKRPITVNVLQKLDITKLEKFNYNVAQRGLDKAFSELTKNYKGKFNGVDLQHSFDFEEVCDN